MKIIRANKTEEYEKPKILFGIVMPEIISKFYDVVISESTFENIIRDHLNIYDSRLIKLVEAVDSEGKSFLILVIYDKLLSKKLMLKEKLTLEVKDFDFDIYHYNFNNTINVENEIKIIEKMG